MEFSIKDIKRPVRRRLQRIAQRSSDADHRRRANAVLLLNKGDSARFVAQQLHASRNSVRDWKALFERHGEAGLVPELRGRPESTVTEQLCATLLSMVQKEPREYGFLRSRWTSEMLAAQIAAEMMVVIHDSTIRRLLPKLGIVWNRARPTLCIADAKKSQKMRAIQRALDEACEAKPVFYVDEADIDLNPRIGFGWMPKGTQTAVPTPGKNQKRYLAGALNAATGNVVWVEWEKKNSEIFLLLMAELRRRYRQAKRIRLIADNYVIHKSAMTQCFLRNNPKFELIFQPAYHPWVNKIELLWKQLHDTVTRNHRYTTMNKLMEAVNLFMTSVAPYPGNSTQLVKMTMDQYLGSAI